MKRKIRILGYEHTVEIKSRLGSAGRSALDWQFIELDSELCEEQLDSALIHEVLHQIDKHLVFCQLCTVAIVKAVAYLVCIGNNFFYFFINHYKLPHKIEKLNVKSENQSALRQSPLDSHTLL